MLQLFDENVIFYQAKAFMFYNVKTTCMNYVRKKNEIMSKTSLDRVTLYSDTR